MEYLDAAVDAIPTPAPTPPMVKRPSTSLAAGREAPKTSASSPADASPESTFEQVIGALQTHRSHSYQDIGRHLVGPSARKALYSAAFIARRLNAPEGVILRVLESITTSYISHDESFDLHGIVAEALARVEPVGPDASMGRPRRRRRPRNDEELAAFADEKLRLSPGCIITSAELSDTYAAWAEERGIRQVLAPHAVVRRLRKLYPEIQTRMLWRDGRTARGLVGVAIVGHHS